MHMKRIILFAGLAILGVSTACTHRLATAGGPNPRPQTWVDCQLYDGVVTPTSLKPNSDAFDELYTGGHGFQDGVPLISDAAPGDRNYNGGRWHLNTLKASVDPDKYSGACSVEDLDLQDFDSTDTYFECPLLPRVRP